MSELSDINKHFNELNSDNSPSVPVQIYGRRESMLRKEIREYNYANGTEIRLIKPDAFVRAFNLLGMPG